MYCPRCGEEQGSEQLRFCPKCGLPMGLVAQLIANGGSLPQLQELLGKKKIFTKRNGVIFSLFWFILFVPFGAAIWGVLEVEELAALSAVFGVFSSILIFLFSLFFLPSAKTYYSDTATAVESIPTVNELSGGQNQQNALPPQQGQTAQEYVSPGAGMWKAPDTGELAQPGSVTEGTTKLLEKDDV